MSKQHTWTLWHFYEIRHDDRLGCEILTAKHGTVVLHLNIMSLKAEILSVSYPLAVVLNFAATGHQRAMPTCSRWFFKKNLTPELSSCQISTISHPVVNSALSQLCDLRVQCSSPLTGLEPAVSCKHSSVTWAHLSHILPLPSQRLGRYQIILLGDRGTWVWTTCPELLLGSGQAGSRTRNLSITSQRPTHWATEPQPPLNFNHTVHDSDTFHLLYHHYILSRQIYHSTGVESDMNDRNDHWQWQYTENIYSLDAQCSSSCYSSSSGSWLCSPVLSVLRDVVSSPVTTETAAAY